MIIFGDNNFIGNDGSGLTFLNGFEKKKKRKEELTTSFHEL
jgi:hypothetical protein